MTTTTARLNIELIETWLADNHMSKNRLAKAAGLNPTTVYKAMTMNTVPGMNLACGIRYATGLSLDDLVICLRTNPQ